MSSEHIQLEPPRENHHSIKPIADKDAAIFTVSAPMRRGRKRASAPVRIIRLPEVMNRVGLKRASIYAAIARGSFPKQIALGDRAVGWIEQEIDAWLAARVAGSRRKYNRQRV